jgi:metal-responsive CopG/Arc/MetJ family transcriptional regulator
MSNAVAPKKRGRPSTGGRQPHIALRLPADLLTALERFAEAEELSRSEVIRLALADYLKRKRAL